MGQWGREVAAQSCMEPKPRGSEEAEGHLALGLGTPTRLSRGCQKPMGLSTADSSPESLVGFMLSSEA